MSPPSKDVKTKVVKIGDAGEIPNDTISVRTGLDPGLVAKIKAALLKYAETPDGKKTLKQVYDVDGMVDAKDSDYDPVRVVARSMDVQLSAIDNKPKASPSPSASPSGK
jgi:phosphonate transport system substrate-binding protein